MYSNVEFRNSFISHFYFIFQAKMSCVVMLKYSKRILYVKSKWIEGFNKAENLNNGTRTSEIRKIFYSPVPTLSPYFRLKTQKEFCDEAAACYAGYVLEVCGKCRCFYRHTFMRCSSFLRHFFHCLGSKMQVQICHERKLRLRRNVPKNYCENIRKRPKKILPPKSQYDILMEQIQCKIERITGMREGILIGNKERDKVKIQSLDEDDIDEMDDILIESDTDGDGLPVEDTFTSNEHAYKSDSDGVEVLNSGNVNEDRISTGMPKLKIDGPFSSHTQPTKPRLIIDDFCPKNSCFWEQPLESLHSSIIRANGYFQTNVKICIGYNSESTANFIDDHNMSRNYFIRTIFRNKSRFVKIPGNELSADRYFMECK